MVVSKHKLVEPSKTLQENVCSRHNELIKMFCRTDRVCICYLCFVDKHRRHDAVSAEAEWTERQEQLWASREEVKERIQSREDHVDLLQREMEAIDRSADQTVESSERIFSELIQVIQRKSGDVRRLVRSQQETEVNRARELQEKLKQEISELRGKDAELERLTHMEDHTQFLRSYPSPPPLGQSPPSPGFKPRPLRYFEAVTAAVSGLRDHLQALVSEDCTITSGTVAEVDVLLSPPAPVTREDFLKYSCEITLDVNTAHNNLMLSNSNRKVTAKLLQLHPLSAERFTESPQVLSRERLGERCYWEVECRGQNVSVAVASKNADRVGSEEKCNFGWNDKSWALYCGYSGCFFWYNSIKTEVSRFPAFKVGVYLDQRAGALSFFHISDSMTLLHRVHARFPPPLLAGLGLHGQLRSGTAEIRKLE
uniref:B30.2/SPRY domain-containing protein n=1 Tax=Salarias fasciatus TaxID=181472 RepID=A0A672F5M9_SALFA